LADLKQALLTRFRPEQVGRMGNTHVIYPSLSEGSFRRLIRMQLDRIGRRMREDYGLAVEFTPAVHELIYDEGVVPGQGTRPLLASITELIQSRLPAWLVQARIRPGVTAMRVGYDADARNFTVRLDERALEDVGPSPTLRLTRTRSEMHPPMLRETVAVHEAGHVVAGIVAMGVLPLKVMSRLAMSDAAGHVQFPELPVLTRAAGLRLLEQMLGGRAAEEWVFGPEHVSSGAESDLRQATNLVSRLISEFGMGGHVGVSSADPHAIHNLSSRKPQDDRLKEAWLAQAGRRARAALESQRPFFAAVAGRLMEQPSITRKELERIFRETFRATLREKEIILARHQAELCARHVRTARIFVGLEGAAPPRTRRTAGPGPVSRRRPRRAA
jgi:cell division protease FtsH